MSLSSEKERKKDIQEIIEAMITRNLDNIIDKDKFESFKKNFKRNSKREKCDYLYR